jgi:NADH-quinone oxidoreductase subunit E
MENGKLNSEEIRLSDAAEARIQELVTKYPDSKSAVMPALYMAQEELGWLTDDAYRWVSSRLDLAIAHVVQVATFYTMYYKKPVGKYHVQVCRTLSCMVCGARNLTAHLQKRLGLKAGEISEDGMWSYEEVECLGSCGSAPMLEINDIYFENLTAELLDQLMDRIEKEQPDLRYSTVRQELGEGLTGRTKSEVLSQG